MYTTLIVLMVIIAIILILVIMIQNPKGGGISGEISGGNQMFGVQQTGDILEKITWGAASLIVIFAIVSSLLITTGGSTEIDSANVNAAQSKAAPAQKPAVIPAQPAPAQSAPAPAK